MPKPIQLSKIFSTACTMAKQELCYRGEKVSCLSQGQLGVRQHSMVEHCKTAHGFDLVKIRSWWWLVPRR